MSYRYASGKVAELFPGDTVRLRESGVPTDYLVLAKGTHGAGENDALAIRKELLAPCYYFFASAEYQDSTVDRWLSHGFVNTYSDGVRAALVPATLDCWDEFHKEEKTLERVCFLLSATEFGFTSSTNIAVEGTAVPYFSSDASRVAQYVGTAMPYGTRTAMKSSIGNSVHIISVGAEGAWLSHATGLYRLFTRPAVILSGDAVFDIDREIF